MEMKILGQKELHQAVKDAHLGAGCGFCASICPAGAILRDEAVLQ